MDAPTQLPRVIGCHVVDAGGARLGRVIGVVYTTHGVDILVERGRPWRRRGSRYPVERIVLTRDGAVMVDLDRLRVAPSRAADAVKASAVGVPVGQER